MLGAGKLISAEPQTDELVADLRRHSRIGAEKMKKFKRVLLVFLPDIPSFHLVGEMPAIPTANQPE